jgi:hypothetical protein
VQEKQKHLPFNSSYQLATQNVLQNCESEMDLARKQFPIEKEGVGRARVGHSDVSAKFFGRNFNLTTQALYNEVHEPV